MEYATRRPHRVSHLILMNTAPASHAGVVAFREDLQRRRSPEQSERMSALRSDPRYLAGDVATDLEYYRIHFDSAVRRPDQLDRVIGRLRSAFTSEGIVTARAIEDRLYAQTWDAEDYDLIARLRRLRIPTLFIHGDGDFVPIDVAREAADAIRGLTLRRAVRLRSLRLPGAARPSASGRLRAHAGPASFGLRRRRANSRVRLNRERRRDEEVERSGEGPRQAEHHADDDPGPRGDHDVDQDREGAVEVARHPEAAQRSCGPAHRDRSRPSRSASMAAASTTW